MASVRCRRVGGKQLKEKEFGIIPKINVVELEPSQDLRNKNHIEAPPMQIMYIMADLSPRERAAEEEDEYVLCCLQLNANGVLCIRPDFNRGRKPYITETLSAGRDWYADRQQQLAWVTQTCATKTIGRGTHLSKFGFRTETTGNVTANLNIMMQSSDDDVLSAELDMKL
nr:hypothetical protein BaRGS_007841 [Batillaria attramentaria]